MVKNFIHTKQNKQTHFFFFHSFIPIEISADDDNRLESIDAINDE